MKKILQLSLLLLALPLIFGASKVQTVQYVIKNSQNEDNVTLEGKLVQQTDSDEFIFQDSTGKIKVEFDDDVFGAKYNNPMPALNTKIKILGIVDKEFMEKVKLEVIRFKYLEKIPEDDF